MAAAQAGALALSSSAADVRRPAQLGVRRECSGSTVTFASRRSRTDGGFVSVNRHRPSSSRAGSRVVVASAPASGSRVVRTVAAEKTAETVEPASTAAPQKSEYHFLIANAKFMLDDEEHFQELMRERLRHFGELNRKQDFWLVIEPEFLAKFPDFEKRLGRPAVALVSTDSTWITFMKLRLDRVLKGFYEADTLVEALAGGNHSTEIKFEKPGRWTAPYSKYEGVWWTPFLPPQ